MDESHLGMQPSRTHREMKDEKNIFIEINIYILIEKYLSISCIGASAKETTNAVYKNIKLFIYKYIKIAPP